MIGGFFVIYIIMLNNPENIMVCGGKTMYEIRMAANLYDVEQAYREPLLRRMVESIRPGETKRIWGRQSFLRQMIYDRRDKSGRN
jgi:hypothetical protein